MSNDQAVDQFGWLDATALPGMDASAAADPLFDYACRAALTAGSAVVTLYDLASSGLSARIIQFKASIDPSVEVFLNGTVRCTAPPHAWSHRALRFKFDPEEASKVRLTVTGASATLPLLFFGSLAGTGLGKQAIAGESVFSEAALFEIATSPESQVVNLNGGSLANGAVLDIWEREYSAAQHWRLQEWTDSSGEFLLVNALSGKAITVHDMSSEAGAALVQWEINGKTNQLWTIDHAPLDAGGRRFTFASVAHHDLVMDLRGGVTDNGTVLQQWSPNGQFNQAWLLRTLPA